MRDRAAARESRVCFKTSRNTRVFRICLSSPFICVCSVSNLRSIVSTRGLHVAGSQGGTCAARKQSTHAKLIYMRALFKREIHQGSQTQIGAANNIYRNLDTTYKDLPGIAVSRIQVRVIGSHSSCQSLDLDSYAKFDTNLRCKRYTQEIVSERCESRYRCT